MMPSPARVIAGWTLGNVVLASLLIVFHEKWQFVALYLVAAVPMFAIAGGVAIALRRRPEPPEEYRMGQRSGLVLPLAIGITAIGLGLIYGFMLIALGALLVLLVLVVLLGRPVTTPAGPDEYVAPHPVPAAPRPRPVPDDAPAWLRAIGRIGAAAVTVRHWRRVVTPRR